MDELPVVLTVRDMIRLANLGVPEAERITRWRLRRLLVQKGILAGGGYVEHIDLATLTRAWPEFVEALRWRVVRSRVRQCALGE
jgi:hypothetical protein